MNESEYCLLRMDVSVTESILKGRPYPCNAKVRVSQR